MTAIRILCAWSLAAGLAWSTTSAGDGRSFASHPPLRPLPVPAPSADLPPEPRFVDPQQGRDDHPGTLEQPWRTLQHALDHRGAGESVVLRGGVCYERVVLARGGAQGRPLIIQSYPGELAVIDAALPAFQTDPAGQWEPVPGGAPDEYRSRAPLSSVRDVVARFADSLVALQTYSHRVDLVAQQEFWLDAKDADVAPVYCGPGVWLNPQDQRLHIRLAPTSLPGVDNYRGTRDPRELPLIIAPFRATPLTIDGASHVVVRDLVLRGGGRDTLVLQGVNQVEFQRVTVFAGTYGLRARNARHLRFLHSAIRGCSPPWNFRNENALRDARGSNRRDIARLTTHALWVSETGREFDLDAWPQNDQWEIAFSEFTDSHDGLYLGGIDVRFHHNLVDNMQDDGIYLSPMYPWTQAQVHVFQNLIRRTYTALAFGGSDPTRDVVWIYRNVIDQRGPTAIARPTGPDAPPGPGGAALGDHGSPPWPTMNIYHNTVIVSSARHPAAGFYGATDAARPRRVMNNLFLHLRPLPAFTALKPDHDAWGNGNQFWSDNAAAATASLERYRQSPAFGQSKDRFGAGCDAATIIADPQLSLDGPAVRAFTPPAGSPAVDAGVLIPADWPDPCRDQDPRPDIGALPAGAELHAGWF